MENGNGDRSGTDHFTPDPSVPEELHTAAVDIEACLLIFITSWGCSQGLGSTAALTLIDTLEIYEENALDLGCGYGAIGTAAALLAPVLGAMVDLNRRA